MRQGCVLNPRDFLGSFVLQLAMRKWKFKIGHTNLGFVDWLPRLVDLRFVEDIPFGATCRCEASSFRSSLTDCLAEVGAPSMKRKQLF